MMASPSELSLECRPQSQPPYLYEPLQTHKLEEYLSCLEEERLKIDAFKRELPLCMHLLTNAMEASRQQLQSYKASSANQVMIKRPILEEFIPMKHSNSEGPEDEPKAVNNKSDKVSWMTSAQLWSQTNETKELDMGFTPKLSLLDDDNKNNDNNVKKQRNGGAFLPFAKERNTINASLPDLSLSSDEREMEDKNGVKSSESGLPSENSGKVSNDIVVIDNGATTTATTTQPNRKQRRCWSPDLHRRFVNALQMLGGSQVATPKQIRELMKVDGLTNDEVKSHLQKYRLHTRRPGPSPQGAGAPGPQLVVLGGIWVPPEYATAAHHHHHGYNTQPTAQAGPHYYPPGIQREFYPSLPQAGLHQVHIYKGSSNGQSSPESHGERGARDQSESIEDGKSESSSGEESNERKKLASKRDGEEESNGSQIILKF